MFLLSYILFSSNISRNDKEKKEKKVYNEHVPVHFIFENRFPTNKHTEPELQDHQNRND